MNDDKQLSDALAKLFGRGSDVIADFFAKPDSLSEVVKRNVSRAGPLGVTEEDWTKACEIASVYYEGTLQFFRAIAFTHLAGTSAADRKFFRAEALKLARKLKPLAGVVKAWSLVTVELGNLAEEMRYFVDICHEEEFALRTLLVLTEVQVDSLLDQVDAKLGVKGQH